MQREEAQAARLEQREQINTHGRVQTHLFVIQPGCQWVSTSDAGIAHLYGNAPSDEHHGNEDSCILSPKIHAPMFS